ncbi:MAG: ABC transporter substrate-binding protein [Actinomycetota bacterium]
MRKAVRLVAVVAVLAIVAAACSKSGTPEASSSASAGGEIQQGGTLHLAQTSDVSSAFDPQKEYYQLSWSYFRCCLLRTLLSSKQVPLEDGGGDLQPDLAADLPTVSDDGLTYTFTIKPGIKYSPPLQDVEVTAQDFVRAIEREADPKASSGGYPFYYSVIEGFDDFGAGKADSISGLSAPDDQTFVVKITEPAGDLPWRFAMPATAPIPPNPADPQAPLGVADGHTTNYGRYLVGTGPYMFEGSENLDFSVPANDQEAVAGYIPGRQVVLVRNPSYDPATDGLRPAYPDRIEATIGGDVADLFNKVDTGEVDYVADTHPPANVLQEYSTNPEKQPYLHTYPTNGNYYISMNLGVPPFDDIHVRKALNYVFDKAGSIQLSGGALTGSIEEHIFPDGLLDNKLKDYAPYATEGGHGDLELAKAEMAQSKYDTNGDGVCDDPVCQNVIALGVQQDPGPRRMAVFSENLKGLGIEITPKLLDGPVIYSKCISSPDQFPLCVYVGWVQDYADAYTFGPPLFDASSLYPACCNYSLLGASQDQLKEWGYPAGTTVPDVGDMQKECAAIPVGDERFTCWANFDKYLMENVVPWVPVTFSNNNDITSARVINYSFDYGGQQASFDSFAFANGGA